MTHLVFIDTETTSLRPDRRAWEVGLIVRRPAGPDHEQSWFIAADDLDLGNADPMALNIGRFYDRHPRYAHGGNPNAVHATERAVLQDVERWTRGAHLIGAVPNFDTEVLGARMRAHGIAPSWHYHLIDVETLAVGWLHRHAAYLENRTASIDEATALRNLAGPPWKSDHLADALGVKISDEDRHTALGDAKWARDMYDAVMGGRS